MEKTHITQAMLQENGLLSRRHLLALMGSFPLLITGCTSATQLLASQPTPDTKPAVNVSKSLWSHAAVRGLVYGATTGSPQLMQDAPFVQALAQQAVLLTPENELKWGTLRPSLQTFDFSKADALIAFAQQQQMWVRGHNLVWGDKWFAPGVLAQLEATNDIQAILTEHITTVVQRYAGKMYSWDVVNEPLAAHLTTTPYQLDARIWQRRLGTAYLDLAFQTAAAADPHALLVLNEYGFETGVSPTITATVRQTQMLTLLESLVARKVPIHALGLEAHLLADKMQSKFDAAQYRAFLRSVAQLGLHVLITELDVSDVNVPGDIATRDQVVADTYAHYLSVVLDEPAVLLVNTWGLSDRYSWLQSTQHRPDGQPLRPLPLSPQLRPTPAWFAIARAFDQAPARTLLRPLRFPRALPK